MRFRLSEEIATHSALLWVNKFILLLILISYLFSLCPDFLSVYNHLPLVILKRSVVQIILIDKMSCHRVLWSCHFRRFAETGCLIERNRENITFYKWTPFLLKYFLRKNSLIFVNGFYTFCNNYLGSN